MKKKVLVQLYHDFPFDVFEMEEGDKTISGRRISGLNLYEATKENVILAKEYNETLKEKEKKLTELKGKMKKII